MKSVFAVRFSSFRTISIGVLFLAASIGVLFLAVSWPASADERLRRVTPNETWEIREGRFYRNGQWVFIKTGKILTDLEETSAADRVIADINVMIDRLDYNNFSLNIYPDRFDRDGDSQVDPPRHEAAANVGRILDHCWRRGVFCCLSFETYNAGGGGTPDALFRKYPDMVALNALGQPARDVEYGGQPGKLLPSIFHPRYLEWSRGFIREFLAGLGRERTSRLLYVETTVEPQYLGNCNVGDKDRRRAALDYSDAARTAFEKWQAALPAEDPARSDFRWPATQEERDRSIGNRTFNRFRGEALGQWVSGDIRAVHSAAPEVYIAVDYNGRFDDADGIRVGDHEAFLTSIEGADIIQVAPHIIQHWSTLSWDEVLRVNRRAKKGWAVSEHMTATGDWEVDDRKMTEILDNTLARGTRWGWEFVSAGNRHATDSFHVYSADWTSEVLDVIEGGHWDKWLAKIGATGFKPVQRQPATGPE